MTLDSIFIAGGLLGAVGFTLAVGGAALPIASLSHGARGDLGRLWGGVFVGLAVLVVLAGIVASDPDGVPWGTLGVLGAIALIGVLSGIYRSRSRIAEDRAARGKRLLTR